MHNGLRLRICFRFSLCRDLAIAESFLPQKINFSSIFKRFNLLHIISSSLYKYLPAYIGRFTTFGVASRPIRLHFFISIQFKRKRTQEEAKTREVLSIAPHTELLVMALEYRLILAMTLKSILVDSFCPFRS